jgi:CubicO group peptidase (beta-lactamase class C family)
MNCGVDTAGRVTGGGAWTHLKSGPRPADKARTAVNGTTVMDADALKRLEAHIKAEIDKGMYDGCNIIVSRRGKIGLEACLGSADLKTKRTASPDDIFYIFSMTKAFTNVLVLKCLERGKLDFTTRVVDIIPEFVTGDRFRQAKKSKINIVHLLTHRAGLVTTPTPLPYDQLGNLENTVKAICELDVVGNPGGDVDYSPALNHALLGEMARRVLGYPTFREMAKVELFEPLKMTSTAIGAPKAWAKKMVPVRASFPEGGWLSASDVEIMEEIINEEAEMPWVGAVSTIGDIHRFAEMLRRGGELDGVRILSPAILDLATTNLTGDLTNNLYANISHARGWDVPKANFGLGFALSGEGIYPSFFGTITSPRTFGNYGAGSTLFWVDPKLDMTFVCLTVGVMEEGDNVLRFQRLSAMAAASAI